MRSWLRCRNNRPTIVSSPSADALVPKEKSNIFLLVLFHFIFFPPSKRRKSRQQSTRILCYVQVQPNKKAAQYNTGVNCSIKRLNCKKREVKKKKKNRKWN
jgi:hypothetical protein